MIEELEGSKTVMNLSFFAPPELYSNVMKSSFVMSSQDVKLSSWVAELALLLAAAEQSWLCCWRWWSRAGFAAAGGGASYCCGGHDTGHCYCGGSDKG
jgi:hypothetical protein